MKTRKTVIAVLTAVLVISAVLIAGCIDPLEQVSVKPKAAEADEVGGDYLIPVGKGVVRLKFSDDNIRTVLPDTTLTNFTFDVAFTSTSNAANNESITNKTYDEMTSNTTYPIALAVDTYTVSLVAKTTAGNVASWNNGGSPITIADGTTRTFNVTLAALGPSTGTGTFKFTITPSTTASSTTTLDILAYSGGTLTSIGGTYPGYDGTLHPVSYPRTISVVLNNETELLSSGYYVVKVKATLAGYQTYEYVQALHIYQNMTSTMGAVTVGALTKNLFDVEFDLNMIYGDVDDTADLSHTYDGTTQHVLYGNFAEDPGIPVSTDGNGWVGWSTSDSATSADWVFNVNRVFDDVELFGVWVAPGTKADGNFNITFTITEGFAGFTAKDDDNNTVTSISRAALFASNPSTPTVSLILADGGYTSVVGWSISGVTFDSVTNSSYLDQTHIANDTLVINNSQIFWELLGGDFITINVVVYKDGTFSPTTPIKITFDD